MNNVENYRGGGEGKTETPYLTLTQMVIMVSMDFEDKMDSTSSRITWDSATTRG